MKNLKFLSCAMALPSLTALPAQAAGEQKPAATDKRPNVIFILMDDAGLGDFGCYGQTRTETPHIDALRPAASGSRTCIRRLRSPRRRAAACSRASTRAMRRSATTAEMSQEDPRIWNYDDVYLDPLLEGQAPMAAGTPTLGSVMKQAGYRTAMVGKWGVGGPTTESTPWTMGFDFYYGCICQRLAHNYYPSYMWRNNRKERVNTGHRQPRHGARRGGRSPRPCAATTNIRRTRSTRPT